MANIMDYLEWRGDITFLTDAFNVVDNLILSELSYVPMENYVPLCFSDESISIETLSRRFFKDNDFDSINRNAKHSDRAPILLEKASKCKRYKDIRITNFVNEIDVDSTSQFSAVTFLLPDNSVFVSFRGTDHTIVGWQEDFNMSYMDETAGQKKSVVYLNNICKRYDAVRVGGHSKGGNLAVYSSSFCDREAFSHILEIFSNDGPGFRENVTKSMGYKMALNKLTSIIPKDSVVGMLLESAKEDLIVDSDAYGLEQHDIFSWQISGKKLVLLDDVGSWSKIFSETLMNWLNNISDEDREEFVNIIFTGIYEASMINTESGFDIKVITKFIDKHIKDLPKDKQGRFKDLMSRLVVAGGKNFIKNFIQ
ncbi:MAG: DUF2974 domain-containing protein [Lachnospiraceae bacterium]|nr:DUF2974 domain-containing protein [Lachnospiraceae bacterium]